MHREIPQKSKNMTIKQITSIYIITINIVTFLLYGIDKWKAKHAKWRIPEATLLGLAAIGGSVGAWLGMKVWHHKTMHKKFKYGIPLILTAQTALIWLTSCKGNQSIASATSIQKHQLESDHSPNVFLIMYNAKTDKAALLTAIKEYNCEIVYDYKHFNGMALKKPEGKTLEETMQHFKEVKGIVMVEYDYINQLSAPVTPRIERR